MHGGDREGGGRVLFTAIERLEQQHLVELILGWLTVVVGRQQQFRQGSASAALPASRRPLLQQLLLLQP